MAHTVRLLALPPPSLKERLLVKRGLKAPEPPPARAAPWSVVEVIPAGEVPELRAVLAAFEAPGCGPARRRPWRLDGMQLLVANAARTTLIVGSMPGARAPAGPSNGSSPKCTTPRARPAPRW